MLTCCHISVPNALHWPRISVGLAWAMRGETQRALSLSLSTFSWGAPSKTEQAGALIITQASPSAWSREMRVWCVTSGLKHVTFWADISQPLPSMLEQNHKSAPENGWRFWALVKRTRISMTQRYRNWVKLLHLAVPNDSSWCMSLLSMRCSGCHMKKKQFLSYGDGDCDDGMFGRWIVAAGAIGHSVKRAIDLSLVQSVDWITLHYPPCYASARSTNAARSCFYCLISIIWKDVQPDMLWNSSIVMGDINLTVFTPFHHS